MNCFPTCNFSVANRPFLTATLALQLIFSPLAVCPVTFKSYSPGALSRSTASKPFRWASLADSRQNGTIRPSQSPCTSARGFALFTSISSRLPWLDSGALKRNVVPGVQVPAAFAIAPGESSVEAVAKHTTAKQVRRFRTTILACKLISAAASPSRALQLFQIASAPASIPGWPFPSLQRDPDYSSSRESPPGTAALLQR